MPISDPVLYKTVKDRWREYLVGSPDENAVHSETYNQRVKNISKAYKTDWDSFKATYSNEEVGKLWDQNVVFGIRGNERKIETVYNNLYDMVLGYATAGSDYYHNPELYSDIVKGLEYGYTNYYGPAVWEKGTYGNWWQWDIGIPLKLTKMLLLLENELAQIMFILHGSRFEFYQDNVDNQYRWAFENFQPVIYGGRFFASARGREVYSFVLKSTNWSMCLKWRRGLC